MGYKESCQVSISLYEALISPSLQRPFVWVAIMLYEALVSPSLQRLFVRHPSISDKLVLNTVTKWWHTLKKYQSNFSNRFRYRQRQFNNQVLYHHGEERHRPASTTLIYDTHPHTFKNICYRKEIFYLLIKCSCKVIFPLGIHGPLQNLSAKKKKMNDTYGYLYTLYDTSSWCALLYTLYDTSSWCALNIGWTPTYFKIEDAINADNKSRISAKTHNGSF